MIMYKSIVDFIEVGKGKTSHWYDRFKNVFLGLFWIIGSPLLVIFGVIMMLADTDSLGAGIVLSVAGSIGIVLFFFARKQGKHNKYSDIVAILTLASATIALMFTGDVYFSGILLIFFPIEACIFFKAKRGTIFSCIMVAVFWICGLIAKNDATPVIMTSFSFGMLTIMAIVSGFLIFYEEMESSSDDKISDIQKETDIKNKFISQLSYQIRTPLNNIIGIGNLLNETQLNQRQKDWLETIIASANNLISVVNIIASSVTSLGIVNTKQNIVSFNMQTTIDNAIQLFVGQSDEYNIGLKPNMDTAHILEGDPMQIKQIFMTLIDTIIGNKKAEKINIFVSYRIKQATERLYDVNFEIKVSDHYEFDLENEKNTGMLNFSISSRLISLTGNKLNVTYDNNFTIFSFKLSFNKSQQTEIKDTTVVKTSSEKIEQKDSSSRDTSKVDLKEAKILLVEDNLINQKIVILSIQKLVKNIEIANNGQEAVEKFNTSKHDIILMDLQMPVMDGIQATKKIREIEMEKRSIPTPIIAITANALAGDREHCLASGMDEYISKPFQVEMLVSKMKNLLAIGSSMHQ